MDKADMSTMSTSNMDDMQEIRDKIKNKRTQTNDARTNGQGDHDGRSMAHSRRSRGKPGHPNRNDQTIFADTWTTSESKEIPQKISDP